MDVRINSYVTTVSFNTSYLDGRTMAKNKSHQKTRQLLNCPVFGAPSEMSVNMLPTKFDVMRKYLFRQHGLKINPTAKEPTFSEIAVVVADSIEKLWHRASIPIISRQKILEKLRLYHDSYRNLMRPYKSRQHDLKYKTKISEFIAESKAQLFDICTCKCLDINLCNCQRERKVPTLKRNFLIDQRTIRTMMIGGVDATMTKTLRNQCASALASAMLQDVGIVNEADSSMIVDRSKVRRERKKVRKELQSSAAKQISGLYFDGRKDKIRVQVRKGRKYYPKVIVEEHISLVREP